MRTNSRICFKSICCKNSLFQVQFKYRTNPTMKWVQGIHVTGHFDCLKYWQKFVQYRDFLESFKLIILARPSRNSSYSTPSFGEFHCVKSVRIRSYYGPYSVRMQENTDQNNSEYGHFSHRDGDIQILLLLFRVAKCFTSYVSTGRKYLLWFSNILQNVFTKKI